MATALLLEDRHYQAIVEAAQELDMTPQQYVQALVEGKKMSFDEVLGPLREEFAKSGISEDALNNAVNEARREVRELGLNK